MLNCQCFVSNYKELLFDPAHTVDYLLPAINDYIDKESEHEGQRNVAELRFEHRGQPTEVSGKDVVILLIRISSNCSRPFNLP